MRIRTKQNQAVIVDASGNLISSADMLSSGGGFNGGQQRHDMLSWSPAIRSADAELLPDIESMTARSHDLQRNYDLVRGGIRLTTDNVVGSELKLSYKPMWRRLNVSDEWVEEHGDDWIKEIESGFWCWANDPGFYCDAGRRMRMGVMQRLAALQHQISGAVLATAEWLPNRNTRYATTIQMIDPSRLSNPNGAMDSALLRKGIGMDGYGAPKTYHIRAALQSDMRYAGAKSYRWKSVSRETKWGRRKVIHIYDMERPHQSHGITRLAAIIAPAFKLDKLQDTALEAAILNAMYAATIETDFNYVQASELLGSEQLPAAANSVLDAIGGFYEEGKGVKLGGVKVPHMYPGERLNFSPSNNPGPNFADFETSFIRRLAAGQNLTYEQLSRDYSKTNYSGARAGLQEAWKYFQVERDHVAGEFSSQVFALWLEEAIDKGDVELPPGAPSFYDARAAYCRCRWIGPGRGAIDPLKEAKADELEMDMDVLTFEDACAKRGLDWEEVLEQRARERRKFEKLKLTRPEGGRGYMAQQTDNGE